LLMETTTNLLGRGTPADRPGYHAPRQRMNGSATSLDPESSVTLQSDFLLPPTLPPGRELYLRATLNERTAAVLPVLLPSSASGTVDMSSVWTDEEEGPSACVYRT
jgi:hypothetical protein